MWLWGQDAELGHAQGTGRASPMQVFMSRDAMKPSKQRQRYSPGMLVHCPPSQISGLSSHSSISAERRPRRGEHSEGGRRKSQIVSGAKQNHPHRKILSLGRDSKNETPPMLEPTVGDTNVPGAAPAGAKVGTDLHRTSCLASGRSPRCSCTRSCPRSWSSGCHSPRW